MRKGACFGFCPVSPFRDISSNLSRALSCLCLTGHNCLVQRMRHNRNRRPYELRICDICDWRHSVQDEEHILLDCPHEQLVSLRTQHRQLVFPPQYEDSPIHLRTLSFFLTSQIYMALGICCPESLVARGQARLFKVASLNPPGSVSTLLSDSSIFSYSMLVVLSPLAYKLAFHGVASHG